MGKLENTFESYLHQRVKAVGGTTRKYVSPGTVGVADRLVIYNGRIYMVEVKSPTGRLSVPQLREHERMARHGIHVHIVHNREEIDGFIENYVISKKPT